MPLLAIALDSLPLLALRTLPLLALDSLPLLAIDSLLLLALDTLSLLVVSPRLFPLIPFLFPIVEVTVLQPNELS